MIDRSITDAEFGRDFLGGKSARTARSVIAADGIPVMKIRGHWLIKLSDAEAWREARTHRVATRDLFKARLQEISDRALAKAKRRLLGG